MTTTTASASSVDIQSNDDLPLSAHLTEPESSSLPAKDASLKGVTTSAESAVQLLGGKGSRTRQPSSVRRSLLQKVTSVLVFCVLLGSVLFLWFTVRQQQIQLTTLDEAFRSGQLQALPERMQAIEGRQQQYVLKSQSEKWQQRLSEQIQNLTTLQQQLSTLGANVEEIQASAAQAIAKQDETGMKLDTFQKALDAQVLRIDTLDAWKKEWRQRALTSTKTAPPPGGSQPVVKKPPKPRVIKPPFTLVSIERRGGQAYAVILPAGKGGWAQLHMLSPGESLSGWMLMSVNGSQAEFQVNGQIQRLTL